MIPSTTTPYFSIREKQIDALVRMLNFNRNGESKETIEEPWKLLIYDDFCRDIIAPVLKVGELRKQGVTLHMSLNSSRQPIPDVPALYFLMPSKENIERICEDCKNHLYDSFHLNFASSISRPLLEELAVGTMQSGSSHFIEKIYDQYLNFVSLENELFHLNIRDSYISFNDPTLSDVQAERNIEQTVDALFAVLVTLGVVPIIRCPKNGASEAVGRQLDAKLLDHLSKFGNLFSDNTTPFQRPVLIILDRNADIPVMLQHAWTYQTLVHDLLQMNLNRVQVEVEELENGNNNNTSTVRKETKTYDLDDNDAFWSQNTCTPFQNIAVAVNACLKEYKTAMDDFSKMSGGVDIEKYDESQVLGRTKDLGTFVNTIPALREKKRVIDVHTNIATALLAQIKARELDIYFAMEETLLSGSFQEKKDMLSLLFDPARGTAEDKIRLFLIYFLCTENISQADMEQFEENFRKMNVDISPLKYLKKTRAFQENMLGPAMTSVAGISTISTSSSSSSSSMATSSPLTTTSNLVANSGGSGTSYTNLRGLLQKVHVETKAALGVSVSSPLGQLLSAGVKALMPASKACYVTRVADALMESKNERGFESRFLYLDPKIPRNMRQSAIPRRSAPFREAFVFVVGGGNYIEFQNLQEFAKRQNRKIIYGSTELLNANGFIEQLKTLSVRFK